MAIKSKEDILASLKDILKEDTSDEALAIIEDVSDTFDDFTTQKQSEIDWEQKYKDNDKEWRERYRDRFFNHSENPKDETIDFSTDEIVEEKTKFEELFSQKGE